MYSRYTSVVNNRKRFEKRIHDPPPDDDIMTWLNFESNPKTFGEIRTYLKGIKKAYVNMDKNRKGLSLLLNRMIGKKMIKKLEKDNTHLYPRYTTTAKHKTAFESALDGYLMKTESIAYMFKAEGRMRSNRDIDPDPSKSKISDRERLVRKLVTCLGVQTLYIILSSYDRPINPNKSTSVNKANREVWLKNALSYHDPIELSIDDQIERILAGFDFAENQFENKRMLKKIALIKKQLQKIYPNITQNMINAENDLEDAKNSLREDYQEIPDMSYRIRI